MSNTTNGVEMKAMIFNGEDVKEWYHDDVLVFKAIPDDIVLFDTNDAEIRRWYLKKDTIGGSTSSWFTAACQTDGDADTWNQIDCTNFNYCTVRVKGNITSVPSSATVNREYIKIGFTDDRTEAIEVVKKSANGDGSEVSQSGLASNKWYDLTLDVSDLTDIQSLNVFIGGSYKNGGVLYCSKITMHN